MIAEFSTPVNRVPRPAYTQGALWMLPTATEVSGNLVVYGYPAESILA